MERFGDANANALSGDTRLRLCANNLFGLDDGSLIVNGVGLSLDDISAPLIRHLAESPGITLSGLVDCLPQFDAEKLRRLCVRLCEQDVIETVP